MSNSTIIKQINPKDISKYGYELYSNNLIPSTILDGKFYNNVDTVEYFVLDLNNNILYSDNDFKDYNFINDKSITNQEYLSSINIDFEKNIKDAGYTSGKYNVLYNFVSNRLGTTFDSRYYISEISQNRKELRLQSNYINNELIELKYNELVNELNTNEFFDEFYLSNLDNDFITCVH